MMMEKGESLFWRRTREEIGAKGNSSNRGLSGYFFSRGRVKGEKTSVKGFESRGERMHRSVHVQLFRIDRDISFSSYLLYQMYFTVRFTFYLSKHLFFSIPILRIQSPLTYSKLYLIISFHVILSYIL